MAKLQCFQQEVSRCHTGGESEESIAKGMKQVSERCTVALKLRTEVQNRVISVHTKRTEVLVMFL